MRPFAEPKTPDASPQRWAESVAEYLARSTMPIAIQTRDWLAHRVSLAPEASRTDLIRRLRAKDDRQHLGACWELGLLGFLLDHGFHLAPHPEVVGTSRHPDWLVTSDDGLRFYLEATTAAQSDEEVAAARRRGALYDALNKVGSADHLLDVRVESEGRATPVGKRLRAQTTRALGNWKYDDLVGLDLGGMPEETIVDEEWSARIRPIPKDADARGQASGRSIGMMGFESLPDPIPLTREALEGKAGAYGDLDAPFVVAVNVLVPMVDDPVISAVLFGSPAYAFATDGSGRTRSFRQPNGFWLKRQPTNRRVAAVVIGCQFAHATTDLTAISAWPNPWASAPLDLAALPFPRLLHDADSSTLRRS